AEIVRAHHERYDGSGYPGGLKRDEIPLLAQILSISSTFVSLVSPRPYRAAYRVPKALSILSGMMGKNFPEYLRDFLTLLRPGYV
ncbi:MAG: HD-GYP domain-containing protein, partial [bacterium]